MKGKFQFIYTRRPNPFLSFYKKENARTRICIIRNPIDRKIHIQFVVSPREYYLNGMSVKVGYVNGVRKSPENQGIQSMFTKRRKCFPKLFFM